MPDRLQGKGAVITGAASGIGRGAAELFVAEGAKVVAADINDELGAALQKEHKGPLGYVRTDVTSEADAGGCVQRLPGGEAGCLAADRAPGPAVRHRRGRPAPQKRRLALHPRRRSAGAILHFRPVDWVVCACLSGQQVQDRGGGRRSGAGQASGNSPKRTTGESGCRVSNRYDRTTPAAAAGRPGRGRTCPRCWP
ncbi:SDR family NAD(P)-dependent oxidoreductase [Micromonospora olivasterospora]|nr:SDR family NAD(P)-dependent oxidoreductase [Micromonospora olivasterospora]